jgi:hypothetical protein
MPLWDSVQRSLEKASHEAARIARTQRLRSTIDGLTRQVNTQQNNIVNKAMDMFVAGQLTSSELSPLCQEMINLQQQLNQARNELQQLQAQASQAQPTPPQASGPHPQLPPGQNPSAPYVPTGEDISPGVYAPAPPEYQSYLDSTSSVTVPPPPPGVESLMGSMTETVRANQGIPFSAQPEKKLCSNCQAELLPDNAFCQNCGAPAQLNDSQHSPTIRGSSPEHIYPGEEATMRADEPVNLSPSSPQAQPSPAESTLNEEV